MRTIKPRKAEVQALAALLIQGAASPEELAELVFAEVDRLRGERSHSYACAIVAGIPLTIGPFATRNQAEKAIAKLGADKHWIVTGWTPEGWDRHLAEVDAPPKPFKVSAEEQRNLDKRFWARVSDIKNGEATAITGKVEIRPLKVAL